MRKTGLSVLLFSSLTVCMGMAVQGNPLGNSERSVAKPKPTLEATADEIAAARSVWQLMGDERFSYLIRSRDEKLAKKVVDAYLDNLDPDHLIFLASDVEKFNKKPMWSLAAMQGRAMVAPLRIHEIYEQRLAERRAWLASWSPSSYSEGEFWTLNREDAAWSASVKEQNASWQRYLDTALLSSEGETPAKVKEAQNKRLLRASAIPRSQIMESFFNSFAQSVDPHASYMLPSSAESMAFELSLSLDGIGAVLSEKDGWIVIEEIRLGSPAAKEGSLKVGDKILAIAQEAGGWVDAKGMRSQDAVNLIRGKSGSSVRLRIAKLGAEHHPQEIKLIRDRIVMTESGAQEKVIEANGKKFGWIRLPVFYADWRQDGKSSVSATKDVEAALLRLKKSNVDGVILDLRNNGGGSLAEAVSLVGLFLPPSHVVQILGADEKLVQLKSERKDVVWSGPLVVLINRGSASASEITAGALQDHGRALVVGEKTFGKGTVQSVVDLDRLWENKQPTLGQMKMTVAQFFRPSGRSTQLNGVMPDVDVAATLRFEEGEERYQNAAPSAKIPAVSGLVVPEWKARLPLLQKQAKDASSSSEGFQSWLRIRNEFEKFSERKTYPLNASENAKQKEIDNGWRQKAEDELKRLGLNGKDAGSDPVIEVTAIVASKWLDGR